ncbi:hypothetical protein [Methylobacterium aquaticum]|nr:hypothetical protein [Methylobacterium aquaticum]
MGDTYRSDASAAIGAVLGHYADKLLNESAKFEIEQDLDYL